MTISMWMLRGFAASEFVKTNATITARFGFFCIQMASFLWLIALVVRQACC
jgi:hypothetical protein